MPVTGGRVQQTIRSPKFCFCCSVELTIQENSPPKECAHWEMSCALCVQDWTAWRTGRSELGLGSSAPAWVTGRGMWAMWSTSGPRWLNLAGRCLTLKEGNLHELRPSSAPRHMCKQYHPQPPPRHTGSVFSLTECRWGSLLLPSQDAPAWASASSFETATHFIMNLLRHQL